MSELHVYELELPSTYVKISEAGDLTNPITTVHDGKIGEPFEKKLYVAREAASVLNYTNIRVSAMSTAGDSVEIASAGGASRGTSGWGVKLLADPGYDPKESDWDDEDYGTTIDIDDISDASKRAFWFRIESPAGIRVENKNSISLVLQFVEAP